MTAGDGGQEMPQPPHRPPVSPLQMFIESTLASSTGSIISRIVCHPLDTCKARLQNPGSPYKTTLQVVQATLREEGIRGLYRGLGTVTVVGTPAFVLYLATYEASKNFLSSSGFTGNYEPISHFTSGMVAETVSCLVYVPVDVIKERLQVQRRLLSGQEVSGPLPMYRGTTHAFQSIMAQEGIRGIYKGYGATLMSFGPFSAFYFLFYEKFKAWSASFTGTDVAGLAYPFLLMSAASAGALASWITNPVDLVRLRLQIQRGASATSGGTVEPEVYKNTLDGVRKILRREGWHGLFKGSGARIAFHTPSTMISMSTYEECKRWYEHLLG